MGRRKPGKAWEETHTHAEDRLWLHWEPCYMIPVLCEVTPAEGHKQLGGSTRKATGLGTGNCEVRSQRCHDVLGP